MKLVLALFLISALSLTGCTKKAETATSVTTTQETATASPEPAPSDTGASGSPAATVTASAAATPTGSPDPLAAVRFTDIAGIYAEKAIKQEAALGIFGTKTGKFDPYGPITRGDYVRWLVLANNAYFGSPQEVIRLAEPNSQQSFSDVPRSDPNFKYIQGMANSGYLVGIDKTHFAPSRKLTREELLAILISRDLKGNFQAASLEKVAGDTGLADANKISKPYWGAIDADHWSNIFGSANSLGRVFGPVKYLHPQQLATRSDAAVAISLIQTHSAEGALKNGPG